MEYFYIVAMVSVPSMGISPVNQAPKSEIQPVIVQEDQVKKYLFYTQPISYPASSSAFLLCRQPLTKKLIYSRLEIDAQHAGSDCSVSRGCRYARSSWNLELNRKEGRNGVILLAFLTLPRLFNISNHCA